MYKSDKVLQQQQTKNKQTTIFSAKNESSISRINFTKSERKVRFGQFFFWKWLSEKDAVKEKILSLQFHGQNPKIVTKIEFTPFPVRKIFPFFKGF